ncbi:TPA: hypothetical protein DCX15_04060 [bacterium]|nr:hypothetical protein [bacterium]
MKRKVLSCLLILSILFFSLPLQADTACGDVSSNHWAYEAVSELVKRGIMKGYLEKGRYLYKGDKPLTRYEFAVALEKLIRNLEEEMIVLVEQAKPQDVNPVLKAFKESIERNEEALTGLRTKVVTLEASLEKTMNKASQLEDRIITSEEPIQQKPLPNWVTIGTAVVAVTALVIAVSK